MAPTLRCPAKKGAFSVGLNFVMGVDVSAFGFQKSVSMQLIPVPGPNGETCKRIGKPSGLSIYNLKSEMQECQPPSNNSQKTPESERLLIAILARH